MRFGWLLAIVVMAACTDEDRAKRVLEEQGYTHIEMHGYALLSCGKDDSTCTEFRAKSPAGKWVHGVVGCSYMGCTKACTVRMF